MSARQPTGGYIYGRKGCAVCGEMFQPRSGSQKTCGPKCAREQTRRRRLGLTGAETSAAECPLGGGGDRCLGAEPMTKVGRTHPRCRYLYHFILDALGGDLDEARHYAAREPEDRA